MASRHINSFLTKSWPQRYRTARFYFRQGLAKLPYLPVPVRLKITPAKQIEFWWSRVSPFFDANRGFFDYWADDVGDLRFLWKILEPGMVFMDIGAYQGIYSLVAGNKLRQGGTIIAFEPSPRDYRRLRMHLRLNGLSSARAENLALSATAARTTFFQVTSGDTTRNGMRAPASSDAVAEISVEAISLDQYVTRHQLTRLDIIKLDVEGGEMDVLRGAVNTVATFRPILICEVLDATTHVWGYNACEIISTLQDQGYDWFEFTEDGSTVPHQMQREYPRVKNYLAVPHEKCGALALQRTHRELERRHVFESCRPGRPRDLRCLLRSSRF
jgi:FkbM family methyltransferase